jgi:prolyl-tRNA editing enzyme YbaK/EbsC (Cys-tRNA(Pro) deacylase)
MIADDPMNEQGAATPDPDSAPRAGSVPPDTDDDPRAIERAVLDAVAATGEPFEVIEVDPALADTAAFCAHYGYPPEISGNCIVVASKDDPPVLVACLALATTKLDVNAVVRRRLGVRKASFAPAELTRAATGMEIGGVTPFGLPADLPLWADERIAELDRVIVGGGSRSIKLLVPPAALAAVGAEFVPDLARPL